jgi:ribosomal protein S18 acetylase RimI-like enzyme
MKVRRATFGDLPDVVRIERASFAGKGCSVTTFLAHVLRDRKGLLVGEDDTGRVIGYALARVGLRWLGVRRGGVTSIAVDPQHRRRGIGRALMAAALEHLRSQGVAEADLEVSVANRAAQSLYEAFGFVQCQLLPHYYGPNADGIKMALNMRDATISGRAAGARGAQRSSSS